MHAFPKDEALCRAWINAIGRQDLLVGGMAKIRRGYQICDKHFSEDEKFISNHNRTNLKYGSVPDLYLHGSTLQTSTTASHGSTSQDSVVSSLCAVASTSPVVEVIQ
ncbi:hypothetical protein RN001_001612 [Aquatica leii]|uniref:THAP-type domain-containing protein n=1 Tax=Aquatica leii TaxID=1421715 RepID=A0AAN7PLE2_9COLE|nr:hypothetical protein RN001_001612 [Aquatica leii]